MMVELAGLNKQKIMVYDRLDTKLWKWKVKNFLC